MADLPAFPGAEGYGANTTHGRGGRVIEVTNTDSDGPGSFREACESSGPRIIVFRIGGIIRLFDKAIRIAEPYCYVAGIPDDWELAHGLDPDDPADANQLAPSSYTWVEEYLNQLAGPIHPPVTSNVVPRK